MNRTYSLKEIADILEISTTTVSELKKRYDFKKVDKDKLLFLKSIVSKIKTRYEFCSLTTINRYFKNKEIEEKCIQRWGF